MLLFISGREDEDFTTAMLDNKYDWGKYRITVDYKEDIDLVREIVRKLKDQNKFGTTKEIIEILESNPDLLKLNSMHLGALIGK